MMKNLLSCGVLLSFVLLSFAAFAEQTEGNSKLSFNDQELVFVKEVVFSAAPRSSESLKIRLSQLGRAYAYEFYRCKGLDCSPFISLTNAEKLETTERLSRWIQEKKPSAKTRFTALDQSMPGIGASTPEAGLGTGALLFGINPILGVVSGLVVVLAMPALSAHYRDLAENEYVLAELMDTFQKSKKTVVQEDAYLLDKQIRFLDMRLKKLAH